MNMLVTTVTMDNPLPDPPHQGRREIDQAPGDSARVHQGAGQDEERDGQQGVFVRAPENSLGNDGEGNIHEQQRDQAGQGQGERDRNPRHQEEQQQPYQTQDDHCSPRLFRPPDPGPQLIEDADDEEKAACRDGQPAVRHG